MRVCSGLVIKSYSSETNAPPPHTHTQIRGCKHVYVCFFAVTWIHNYIVRVCVCVFTVTVCNTRTVSLSLYFITMWLSLLFFHSPLMPPAHKTLIQ